MNVLKEENFIKKVDDSFLKKEITLDGTKYFIYSCFYLEKNEIKSIELMIYDEDDAFVYDDEIIKLNEYPVFSKTRKKVGAVKQIKRIVEKEILEKVNE